MSENDAKIQLTEEQRELWDKIYGIIHDEGITCGNLASMIDIVFPDASKASGQSPLVALLRKGIKPYLEARAEIGSSTMNLIYTVDAMIDREVKS